MQALPVLHDPYVIRIRPPGPLFLLCLLLAFNNSRDLDVPLARTLAFSTKICSILTPLPPFPSFPLRISTSRPQAKRPPLHPFSMYSHFSAPPILHYDQRLIISHYLQGHLNFILNDIQTRAAHLSGETRLVIFNHTVQQLQSINNDI